MIEATTDAGRVVEIIKGVSLDIADGEIVALIGESGSGKTTIALSLMGYARPGCRITGGEITCQRQEYGGTFRKAARQVARHRHCLRSAKCRRLLQPLVNDSWSR